jgi:hypothetical protein
MEIRMQKTTSTNGTLAEAGQYQGGKGQVVGFACVPSGESAVCYIASQQ